MGCGASTTRVSPSYEQPAARYASTHENGGDDSDYRTPTKLKLEPEPSLAEQQALLVKQHRAEEQQWRTEQQQQQQQASSSTEQPQPRSIAELKKLWYRSFKAADPRQHLVDFFKPGDERGPYGYLRAQGLRPRGAPAHYFSIWRPTSLTAIRMLYDGTATGKGLVCRAADGESCVAA